MAGGCSGIRLKRQRGVDPHLVNSEKYSSSAEPYKFGGKEQEAMFGLDLYDFHARQMDSRVGSFLTVDPLAEKYYSISPYAYCAGNPVNRIDPRGKEIININGGVRFTGQDAISRTPEIYNHTLNSFRMGKPEILHYDGDMQRRAERRKAAMTESGLRPAPNVQRDEYPYASTFEGGHGANVVYVPSKENSYQGFQLGSLYKTLKTGDPFLVIPVPESVEKDPVSQPVVAPQSKPLKQPQGVGSTVSDGLSIGVVAYGIWTVVKWAAAGVAAPETGGASLGVAGAIP
jgi:RHS repeat-associated protein